MQQVNTLQSGLSSLVKTPFRVMGTCVQTTGRVVNSKEFWDLLGTLSAFGVPTAILLATMGPSSTPDTVQELSPSGFGYLTDLFYNSTFS